MNRILVIEDEQIIRSALKRLLERHKYEVEEAGSIAEAIELAPDNFDLIIADLRLPGAAGTDIIRLAQGVPVIIMTSYASVRSAVESMKNGAVDYIAKPFDYDELLLLLERTLKQHRLKRQNAALKQDLQRDYPIEGMVGKCSAMRTVMEQVGKVAPTDLTVLIFGESGTGKELVARAVHEQSQRSEGPMIAVNCAAIPEGLIESELFGHEKGAFTGAVDRHEGLVEAASSGTLFLDEIGELPPAVQVRLLRVLEEHELRPVGSPRTRKIDIRLLAATHRDLPQLVADGRFREDLYYRLHVMEIHLPPLRERGEDILELAQFMLAKATQLLNGPPLRFSTAARTAIAEYAWPGNVRELANAVERAVILCDGEEILPAGLGLPAPGKSIGPTEQASLTLSLDAYFREFVRAHQGQMTETELAEKLGISRKALWERRQRMEIPRR